MVDIKQTLVTSGDSLEDETRSVILALGSKAVAPLLEIFEDEALRDEDGPAGLAPVKAAALLGEIGDPRALEPLLFEYLAGDPFTLVCNEAGVALPKFGGQALEPLLKHYDETPDWEERVSICQVLSELGVRDERIYERLVDALPHDVEAGAGNLGAYGDERALPLLVEAMDAWNPDHDRGSLTGSELRHAIEDLGGELTKAQVAKVERAREFGQRLAALRERDQIIDPEKRTELERRFDGIHRPALWNIRGALAALASGPTMIPPGHWVPEVLGGVVGPEDVGPLLEVYNATVTAMDDAPAHLCPLAQDGAAHRAFCAGYTDTAARDPEWVRAGRAQEELTPLLILADSEATDDIDPDELERSRVAVRAHFPSILENLHQALAPARASLANPVATSVRAGEKVGRNERCPCGSGKKYKKCCGGPNTAPGPLKPAGNAGPAGDEPLENSPLERRIERDGTWVDVCIYRGLKDPRWHLELVGPGGASTVWDDLFETDAMALEEAVKAIDEDGIDSFAANEQATLR